ncbi:MAG: 3-deoxy-manno-octulosonate cytidylyltransferase [Xanthomonadales bacterium]|nr:3-deoxy-manno-octulosonate cytidylyltransferase [Xanthomonadales bacterium]NIX13141.1 3-deoxy-manno-octulosonate cytidylyltransferase [Xanthomonadales bacterium]
MNRTADYVIVIPARFASQRLPGKALADIAGQSLVERVWRRARESNAREVVVATDHEEIARAARGFGAEACMTSTGHRCGSDRITECARIMGWSGEQLIVNLQGDEPLMPEACLDQVAELLASDERADAATLYWPIDDATEVVNPNVVKVVTGQGGEAIYFSRSPIPHPRGAADISDAMAGGMRWYRHLGLYAYRRASLEQFSRAAPTPLELTEKLEQLRFLETGGRIAIDMAVEPIPPGVDTPEDLERIREYFNK